MDGSQNDGGNVLNLLQKEGVPRKRRVGVPSEKGGSNPGGNYETFTKTFASQMSVKLKENVLHYGNFFQNLEQHFSL